MAKAYIANKPVRFDRNYKVGEVIPDGVISPQMGRRLIEMGRILCVDLPDAPPGAEPPQEDTQPPTGGGQGEGEVNPQEETTPQQGGAGEPQDGADSEGEGNTQPETGSAGEGNSDPQSGAEKPQEGGEDTDKENTQGEAADAAEGNSDPQSGAEKPQEGGEDTDKENTQGEAADAAEGNSDGAEGATGGLTAADLINGTVGEFVCEVCGRKFQSQQGLAAHSRSHRE
ncbi:MAG: C2H2-type zinc finger protein [Dysosmobacter sp.]|nr:C2H2-type zinc finger protein [Dysosmobacter sp.]